MNYYETFTIGKEEWLSRIEEWHLFNLGQGTEAPDYLAILSFGHKSGDDPIEIEGYADVYRKTLDDLHSSDVYEIGENLYETFIVEDFFDLMDNSLFLFTDINEMNEYGRCFRTECMCDADEVETTVSTGTSWDDYASNLDLYDYRGNFWIDAADGGDDYYE